LPNENIPNAVRRAAKIGRRSEVDEYIALPSEPHMEEFLTVVNLCLVRYWIGQGTPPDRARLAAQEALKRLRSNKATGTWCLAPAVQDTDSQRLKG
jgi:hypothetical protein